MLRKRRERIDREFLRIKIFNRSDGLKNPEIDIYKIGKS
jgi:hypothetical protein